MNYTASFSDINQQKKSGSKSESSDKEFRDHQQQLLNLFVTHLCAYDFVQSGLLPILVNNENEIFKISSSVTKVFECNHEEGDTRIIFHVLQQKTNVTVYSKDTGVFVLMVFAYAINC